MIVDHQHELSDQGGGISRDLSSFGSASRREYSLTLVMALVALSLTIYCFASQVKVILASISSKIPGF